MKKYSIMSFTDVSITKEEEANVIAGGQGAKGYAREPEKCTCFDECITPDGYNVTTGRCFCGGKP